MKTKKLFFVALIGLQVLLSTCTKDQFDNGCFKIVYLYQSVKDYFYYKPGTWWVYKNTINGKTDSFWVDSEIFEIAKPKSGQQDRKCYEWGFIGISNDSFIKVYNRNFWGIGFRGGGGVHEVYQFDRRPRTDLPSTIYPERVFINEAGRVDISNSRVETAVSQMDTLTLYGKLYKDVILFNNAPSGVMVQDDWFYSAYLVKHMGYVEFIDMKGELWVLERYNIVQ